MQNNTNLKLYKIFLFCQKTGNFYDKNMTLAGGFNLFFNKKLKCKRGRPIIKKRSVSHIIKLQEAFDLCDI